MGNNDLVYEKITNQMVKLLEAGTVPWRKPWKAGVNGPRNMVSNRPYTGINPFLLIAAGYESPYWLTFKQVQERGGSVTGQHGTTVIFWKMIKSKQVGDDGKPKMIPLLKYYTVFNLDQVTGINPPIRDTQPVAEFNPIEAAEKVLVGYADGPEVRHVPGNDRAYYTPSTDVITLPTREAFESADAYYSTAFHEAGHSTGHPNRLHRPNWITGQFGSHPYGVEELTAELTAAFLAGETGILPNTVDNSAAYLGSWIATIKEDIRLVVTAGGRAQKAADHILGREPVHHDDE